MQGGIAGAHRADIAVEVQQPGAADMPGKVLLGSAALHQNELKLAWPMFPQVAERAQRLGRLRMHRHHDADSRISRAGEIERRARHGRQYDVGLAVIERPGLLLGYLFLRRRSGSQSLSPPDRQIMLECVLRSLRLEIRSDGWMCAQ